MSEEMVTVTVFCSNLWDVDEMSVVDFLILVNEALAEIPAGDRADAMMSFDSGYDGGAGDLGITYERPETAEERNAETARLKADRERSEAQERALYERLKARYG